MQGNFHSFAVFDDGTGSKLYCAHGIGPGPGPTFPSVVGVWTGTTWSFVLPPVTGGTIRSICVYDDGTGPSLYISGTFTNPNRIAKWDGGANVSPLGAGVNSAPNGMLVHDDGSGPKLFVYGNLSMAGGMPANRMAKWDGAAWSSAGWVGIGAVDVALSSSAVGGLRFTLQASTSRSRRTRFVGWPEDPGRHWGRAGTRFWLWESSATKSSSAEDFSLFNGVPADFVARWNGMTWSGCPGAPIATRWCFSRSTTVPGPRSSKLARVRTARWATKWNAANLDDDDPSIDLRSLRIGGIGISLFDDGSGLSLFCGGSDLGGNAALSKLATARSAFHCAFSPSAARGDRGLVHTPRGAVGTAPM